MKGGKAHKAILEAAHTIAEAQREHLLRRAQALNVTRIICTGHSLGAGVAALLTVLLCQSLAEFRDATRKPRFAVLARCVGPTVVGDHALLDRYAHLIDSCM
jgi:hypothetical protein